MIGKCFSSSTHECSRALNMCVFFVFLTRIIQNGHQSSMDWILRGRRSVVMEGVLKDELSEMLSWKVCARQF